MESEGAGAPPRPPLPPPLYRTQQMWEERSRRRSHEIFSQKEEDEEAKEKRRMIENLSFFYWNEREEEIRKRKDYLFPWVYNFDSSNFKKKWNDKERKRLYSLWLILLFILRKSSFIKECHLTHRIRLVRGWKSGKIENRKYMNKWRDKRDFSFLYLYLVGRWKSGEIKK